MEGFDIVARVPKVWESLPLARFRESYNQAVIKPRILSFIETKKNTLVLNFFIYFCVVLKNGGTLYSTSV